MWEIIVKYLSLPDKRYHCVSVKTCLSRDDKDFTALDCDFIPRPSPRSNLQRSWFKDGELVYLAPVGAVPDASDFLAANPLLAHGVFHPFTFFPFSNGTILLNIEIDNITSSFLLVEQLVGNWTCVLNNTFGSASRTYIVTKECGELIKIKSSQYLCFWH